MKYFNFIVAIILSVIYVSGRIPPTEKFNLWITSFVIPVALIVNHVLLLVSILLKKKSSLYYVVALLVGSTYLFSTIGLKHLFKSKESLNKTFSVVNFNAGGYHLRPYHYQNRDSARMALRDWLLNADADIRCYQEFSNLPNHEEFNILEQLKRKGIYYYFSQADPTSRPNYSTSSPRYATAGILITSRFPIVSSGDVFASENGFNRIAYADIKIDQDTVRIINVHLESSGLGVLRPRGVKETVAVILSKLKTGVFERSRQIKQLAGFVSTSPYPVICVGDYNDLPYSYNYQFLKKRMKNTFEESGKGLGFTYYGGTIRFLRIDNQFYTSPIRSVGFETMDHIKFSDHFPIKGEYQLQ